MIGHSRFGPPKKPWEKQQLICLMTTHPPPPKRHGTTYTLRPREQQFLYLLEACGLAFRLLKYPLRLAKLDLLRLTGYS